MWTWWDRSACVHWSATTGKEGTSNATKKRIRNNSNPGDNKATGRRRATGRKVADPQDPITGRAEVSHNNPDPSSKARGHNSPTGRRDKDPLNKAATAHKEKGRGRHRNLLVNK